MTRRSFLSRIRSSALAGVIGAGLASLLGREPDHPAAWWNQPPEFIRDWKVRHTYQVGIAGAGLICTRTDCVAKIVTLKPLGPEREEFT